MTTQQLRDCLEAYLASLPLPGRELTSAEVETGQRNKQSVIEGGAASVPVLLDRIGDPDFVVKDASYDLVLEIGAAAKEALVAELGRQGPIVDIWIAVMLQRLGDDTGIERVWPHLQNPVDHVRHLAALALALHFLESAAAPPDQLLAVLVDALRNERTIEGTPFTVGGSALGALTRFSGQTFTSPPRDIQFYNYEHFLYPPPLHPFLFAADYMTTADEQEKRNIRERAQAWLAGRSRSPAP